MSLREIKVSREEVLKIVHENKKKHDLILKDAVEGFWLQAKASIIKNEKETIDLINKNHREQLKKIRKQKKDNLKVLRLNTKDDLAKIKKRDRSKGFFYWTGKYPEDHGDDYMGTIRRLELCVDKELELESTEFDSYIRNKWEWKNSFISSNTGYVTSYYGTGSLGLTASYAMGSPYSSYGISGSYGITASWAASSISGAYAALESF